MNTTIKFTDDLSLENLNPFNYALKNDYIGNLMTTGAVILPPLQDRITFPIVVKRCMMNKATVMSLRNKFAIEESLKGKYTQGLAITVTWEDFDPVTAIEGVRGVMSTTNEKITIVINSDDNYVTFFRECKDRKIVEVSESLTTLEGKMRVIEK